MPNTRDIRNRIKGVKKHSPDYACDANGSYFQNEESTG